MTAPIPGDIPDLPAVPGTPILMPSPAVAAPARRPLTARFRLLIVLTAAGGVAWKPC